MEKFQMGTAILAGSGACARLGELGKKRLFLVTDPYFEKSGRARALAEASGAEQYTIFSEVSPDPTVELAARGTKKLQEFQPDLIAALGGGSAMDTAKAIRYFSKSRALFAAIPTTSGSGSEVTSFAILSHGGCKHVLVDESLQPDWAILDSDLLTTLPTSLIADAGFDVIAHALEAWVGTGAGAVSDLYAREAFCRCLAWLGPSFRGDLEARLPMHLASAMAGIAFTQAGLGLCHAMSHSLGGLFPVPHGRLNAILLPEVVEFNSTGAADRYARLSREAGLGGSAEVLAVRALKNALLRLRRELGLPGTLAEAGVDRQKLHSSVQQLVENTLRDPCCRTNPVPVTREGILQVLTRVAGHG